MMKLNLMKQFFDSVDVEWQSPIADKIAAYWFEKDFQSSCIRASANFAFLVKAGEQKHILRFNHASERNVEFIAGELAFIDHLTRNNVRIARPQSSLNGEVIESIQTSMGLFHATLFEFMPGEQRELDSLDDPAIKQWGQLLAQIHNNSQGLRIEGRPNHSQLIDYVRQVVPKNDTVVWDEANALEEKLKELPVTETNYGMIHFDPEPDNLVWANGEVGTFDLDDSAYAWFAMDIANALGSELFNDHLERFDSGYHQFQVFLDGYRSIRPMSKEELGWIPLFIRLDNLYAYARNYRAIAESPIGDEPQWTKDLRQKLSNKLLEFQENFKSYPIQHIS